jgi:hypothetical protein
MDELIGELKTLRAVTSKECHILMNKNYPPINITKENFHEISNESDMTKSEITFIDGGQALLFESAGFCIGFIRTAAITYADNKRTSKDVKDFYILIKEDDEKFVVKTFPKNDFNDMKFDPEDETLRLGAERASSSRVVSVIRRLAELGHASGFKNPVLDGTLEARYSHESGFIAGLDEVSALSKTCSLTTNTGLGITDYLRTLNEFEWYYYPIVKNNNKKHPAEIYFVKFDDKSDYVFRFEHKGKNAEKIISMLKKNSVDPIFLGYPYGLVDADNTARVSEQEKKMLQTQISVKLGKEWSGFSKMLKSMNAHEILDNIRF